MDILMAEFKSITGCNDDEEAQHMLDACEMDVRHAVELYFDSMESAGRTHAQHRAQAARSSQAASAPPYSEESDTSTQTAADDSHSASGGSAESHEEHEPLSLSGLRFETAATATPASSGNARNLTSLFRAPIDLLHMADWSATVAEARRQQKWLLVNIQQENNFACQTLNRDVWADERVKSVVRKAHFLLWQRYDTDSEGAKICKRFAVDHFPVVFIVDPRTEQKVREVTLLTPEEVSHLRDTAMPFLEQVRAYLQTNSTFEEHDAFKKKAAEGNATAKRETDVKAPPKKATVAADDWKALVAGKDAGAVDVQLAVLLPDGKRENLTLTDNTQLKALFTFIAGRGCAAADHLLQLNHPKREFGVDDGTKTLRELGIGRELIHVRSKLSG